MHDCNGTPLKKGDRVLIPCTIVHLSPGEDYCKVGVTTDLGRRPDGATETFHSVNTGQLIKYRNAELDSPATEDVYFDPVSGFRPEEITID